MGSTANVIFGDFSDYLVSLYNQLSTLLGTKVTKGGDEGPLTVGTTNGTPLTLKLSGYEVTLPVGAPVYDNSVLAAMADGSSYWASGFIDAVQYLNDFKVTKGGDADALPLVIGTTDDMDVVLTRNNQQVIVFKPDKIEFAVDNMPGPQLGYDVTTDGEKVSLFMGRNDVVLDQGGFMTRGRIRFDNFTFMSSPGTGQIGFTLNGLAGPQLEHESTGEGNKGSLFMGTNDVVLAQGASGSRGRVRFDPTTFVSSPSLGDIRITLNGIAGPAFVAGLTSEGLKGNLLMGTNDIVFTQGGFLNRGRIVFDDDTFVSSSGAGHIGFTLLDFAGPQLEHEITDDGDKASLFMGRNDVVLDQGGFLSRGRIRFDDFTFMSSPGTGQIGFTLNGVAGPQLEYESTGEGDKGSVFMGENDVVFAQGGSGSRGRIRYDDDTFMSSPGDGEIAFTVNGLAGPVVADETTGEGNRGSLFMGVNDVVLAQGASGSRGRVRFDAGTFVSSASANRIGVTSNGFTGPYYEHEVPSLGFDKVSLFMGSNDMIFTGGSAALTAGKIRYDSDTWIYSPGDGVISTKHNNVETLEVTNVYLKHYGMHNTDAGTIALASNQPNIHSAFHTASADVTNINTGGGSVTTTVSIRVLYTRVGNIVSGTTMFDWAIPASIEGLQVQFNALYANFTSLAGNYHNYTGRITVCNSDVAVDQAECQFGAVTMARLTSPLRAQVTGVVYNKVRGALVPGIYAFTAATWSVQVDFKYEIS